ncbi:MAG: SDR family oxidoreductase [Myxococcaceae bacterium]|nr:SDR family oxidoreductase [Myxococcaceae bacterium]
MPTHLVTGASDGIGKQTALVLAQKHGATVLVHGRNEARATEAVKSLGAGDFVPVWGDLGSLKDVSAMADRVLAKHPVIDVLLNNAGVFMKERELTADGFEKTMAVNHFGHFLLTHRLLPALKAAKQGRIVHVSSMAHQRGELDLDDLTFERDFSGYGAYSASKLANVLFSNALARRLKGTAVTSNALHPGVIKTKLLATGFGMGGASLASGAATSVYCATEPKLAEVTGEYFSDARKSEASADARNLKQQEAFYTSSCKATGVTPL